MDKPFRILSIDGGGIRGVFPAKILADIEAELQASNNPRRQIYEHFDLICGTSTGGIIAIALALGIPASDILMLYLDKANVIFGKKRKYLIQQVFRSAYSRQALATLIRNKFREGRDEDARIGDCKTNICIPIYDLLLGKPSVLKTRHHDSYIRDFHIPAYQVALATSAAPTYFDPYSSSYLDLHGQHQSFNNKVDGGVVMNNPAMVGITEAQKAFNVDLKNIRLLSLGTGYKVFNDATTRSCWGLYYWVKQNNRKRIIELFMQGQSQQVENLISLMHKGISRKEQDNFIYQRIDTFLDDTCSIALDETRKDRLEKLVEKGHYEYQNSASILRDRFFDLSR